MYSAAGALGVGAAGHLAAHAVLDGDGLEGGGLGEGQGTAIHCALCRRRAAVGGVVDLGTVGAADGHLGRFGELRLTRFRGRMLND